MWEIEHQLDEESCWSACVATMTGLPVDALPLGYAYQLDVAIIPWKSGELAIPAVDELNDLYINEKVVTVDDWQKALGPAFRLTSWNSWVDNTEGIVLLLVYDEKGEKAGHAVCIDKDGILHDPGSGAFQDYHYNRLEAACNVETAGYVQVEER